MIELFKKILDAFLALFSFFKGEELGKLKAEKAAIQVLQAEQEVYDKKAAEIKMQSQINQAFLQKHGIIDWDSSGIVDMHAKNGDLHKQLTTASMQLDRDWDAFWLR